MRSPPPSSSNRISIAWKGIERGWMRKLGIVLGFGIVLALAGFVFFNWLTTELGTPTARSQERAGLLRVRSGMSLSAVAASLADSGWIRHPRLLAWWGTARGIDRKIQAGRYRLERGWSPRDVIEAIRTGRVETTMVTVPEGWREEAILKLLADSLEVEHAELLEASRDRRWVREIGIEAGRLEGYLFPETYAFPKEYDARLAIARMVEEAGEQFDETMHARAEQLGLTAEEIVTLASIIQAEAAREEEMPRISGVFHNRLRHGWKLEADPTVRYALGRFDGRVLYRDLEVDSPYNTYRVGGLPPGPIGNPGFAALRAACWPDSTRGEFYFVAKGNGEHRFSRTLAEHERARRALRNALRKSR
jgi:UPF0755 protein